MNIRPGLKSVTALPLAAGVIVMAGLGCARTPAEKPVEHTVRKVTPETTPGNEKFASGTKEAFEQRLRHNLERLEEEIREVETRVANLKDAAKAEWAQLVADLEAKRVAAEARLDEVRKSAEGAWEHLREGADRAWEELEQEVQKARKKL